MLVLIAAGSCGSGFWLAKEICYTSLNPDVIKHSGLSFSSDLHCAGGDMHADTSNTL